MSGITLRVVLPDENYDRQIDAHVSDTMVAVLKESSEEFEGAVGLPFLRQFKYGGNDEEFWLQAFQEGMADHS